MLASGTRLGPYEILGLIGEGGMGQVYRATDTRLDRSVAIKILPASLAADPVRRERFEREARNVSRLDHPNICPLYDVGDLPVDGPSKGGLFLVMQYLEGETLAQRIGRGPLSIKETLDCAVQIADALAAAHRAGIVHRDLKPGNVMLTRAGARLLDFGLARAVTPVAGGPTTADASAERTSLTTQGTLLGTLHYMAPEQLDGREVDTRADVFSFGAVVFEMVTGLKAFEAETPARVMSAILRDEPARVASVVPITPAGLDELIHTCLAKNPDDRWQGMSDVSRQLRWLQSSLSSAKSGSIAGAQVRPQPRSRSTRPIAIAATVVIALIAGVLLARWFAAPGARSASALHAYLLPPDGHYLTGGLALSPDARTLAFVAADASGQRQLWIRALDSSRAQPLAGTAGASGPFWSASGQEVAFFAGSQLKRVSAAGGEVVPICDAGIGAGGSWNANGVIVFQPHQQGILMRVSATGGRPEPATTLDGDRLETHHLYPAYLPDGNHFVFYVAGKQRGLYLGSLDSSERSFLFDPDPSLPQGAAATPGVYAAGGHLLYVRDRVLMARPFDSRSRTLTGEGVKVADVVDYSPPGDAAFTTAGSILIYRARQHLPQALLAWVDRDGRELSAIAAPPGAFRQLSLSPDGRVVAVDRSDAQGVSSVWTIDLQRGTSDRVPAAYWSGSPVWSADGAALAYSIAADSPPNVVIRGDRGAGEERRLTTSANIQYASSWTPDGRVIVFRAFSNDTGWDLFTIATTGKDGARRLLQTPANENEARISPDGRWLLYTSDDSGRNEVYLTRFPEVGTRRTVSSGGGARPLWRQDGRELYFVGSDNRLMAATMSTDGVVGTPSPLFQAGLYNALYVPAPDGKRFLVARPAPSSEVVPMELRINALAPQ